MQNERFTMIFQKKLSRTTPAYLYFYMRTCSAVTGSRGLATSVLTDIAKTLPTAVFRSYPRPTSQLGQLPFAKPPGPLAQGRLPYPYAPPNPMPPTKIL